MIESPGAVTMQTVPEVIQESSGNLDIGSYLIFSHVDGV